uniref:Uncharacterized protein n=1 Tax=Chenopodium quinoa TaxID=63459 RepID=A0A803LPF7_CHEQI
MQQQRKKPQGSTFNSGGNSNGSGTQTNGNVNVGNNTKKKSGSVIPAGSAFNSGNNSNESGTQKNGNVNVGNGTKTTKKKKPARVTNRNNNPGGYTLWWPRRSSIWGTFNAGGNTNGSGIQKNGDVNVGNSNQKTGGVDIGTIGGNHGNQGGQQSSGNITAGNIGC